jgi:CheY-like chemotaxis protein/HAMP domain-containing protein
MQRRATHTLTPAGLGLGRLAVLVACLLAAAILAATGSAHFHQWQLRQCVRQLVEDHGAESLALEGAAPAGGGPGPAQLRAAELQRILRSHARLINVCATIAILVLGLAVSWFHRKVLRRLEALSAAAGRLASGDPSARVEAGRRDELGALARQFNDLAGWLSRRCPPPPQAAAALATSQPPPRLAPKLARELGAGLTVISVQADMLLARSGDADVLQAATAVRHNSEYLLELVNGAGEPPQPVTGQAQPAPPPPAPPSAASGAPRFRVLLAEDGPENRRLMSFILQKAGAELVIAENGRDAVDQALGPSCAADGTRPAEPFDLILMDMQMPVMDGYEATRRLRQSGYTGLIVAVTGHTTSYDRQRCLEAGCNDYVAKPIDREKFLATVTGHVACRQRHHRPAAQGKPGA